MRRRFGGCAGSCTVILQVTSSQSFGAGQVTLHQPAGQLAAISPLSVRNWSCRRLAFLGRRALALCSKHGQPTSAPAGSVCTAWLPPSLATDMDASFPGLCPAVLQSQTLCADPPPLPLRRLAPHSATDVGILAYSLGATLLAAIQWIGDLRVRVLSISVAKPTGSCVWGLVLLRGKQARPEPAAGSVLEVLSGMLQAFQAPITTSVLPQVRTVCHTG